MEQRKRVPEPDVAGLSTPLFQRITAGSLDSAYLERHQAGKGRSGPIAKAVVFLVCVLLAFSTVVAIRRLHQDNADAKSTTQALASAVETRQNEVDELEAQTAELEQSLEELRGGAPSTERGREGLAVAASSRRVSGPGLAVTVTEAITTGGRPAVGDADLRTIVNALWAGGAEAIGVNGERVGPQTNIRLAGSAILVNLKAVESPYVIEAIGDPTRLAEQMEGLSETFADKEGMSVSWKTSQRLMLGPVGTNQTWYVTPNQEGSG